jgi:hypothetical protein
MTIPPEDALAVARARAAELRTRGAYGPETQLPDAAAGSPPTLEQLSEWALIEPDLREVRSTRRFGAPVTAAKRGLLRLLEQYHLELRSQQTRFNLHLLNQIRLLQQRVDELERRLDDEKR